MKCATAPFITEEMMKVVLITGASSGIGRACAVLFAYKGWRVYAAARRTEKLNELIIRGVRPLYLDVTDEKSCEACVGEVVAREGHIDALVNAAGYGAYGPIETVPIKDAERQMNVNVYGTVRMIQKTLPHMPKGGRIINLGSAGGRAGTYLGGWYHATKYALEALSDALRRELSDYGISVVLIEPGGVSSPWGRITADHLERAGKGSRYEADCDKVAMVYRKVFSEDNHLLTTPMTVARKVYLAAEKEKPRARYLFGFGAKPLVAMNTLLPDDFYDRLMKGVFTSDITARIVNKMK